MAYNPAKGPKVQPRKYSIYFKEKRDHGIDGQRKKQIENWSV